MKRYVPRSAAQPAQQPARPSAGVSILDAMSDSNLFGRHFKNPKDWRAWRSFLASLFGLPLSPDQLQIFQQCTQRQAPPPNGASEAWLVVGRRGGKSFILATIAVYLAAFHDWKPYLGPGERATIMITAADLKQARVILRYCNGLLSSVPMLRTLITSRTKQSIDLSNRVTIESHAASFRNVRGYSLVAALCDELAFWPTDEHSAEPDREILNALRPGLSNIPGSMLLCASSPYARKGQLWEAHKRHYGKDDSHVLVWQAPTRTMHPRIPQRIIDDAMEADPASAAAEYGAQFRSDLESFVLREAVEACVTERIIERMPVPDTTYVGFCDPSGGSGADDMTLSIAHNDPIRGSVVIDCLRWFKPPFSPEIVVSEFSKVLKSYNVRTVVGDRYAGAWPAEQFSKFGIKYEPSTKTKSDLYRDLLPLINSARVALLDQSKMLNQLLALERRTARGGRDLIDHPSGQHDDHINACAGAAVFALDKTVNTSMSWIAGPDTTNVADEARQFRVAQLMNHIAYHA